MLSGATLGEIVGNCAALTPIFVELLSGTAPSRELPSTKRQQAARAHRRNGVGIVEVAIAGKVVRMPGS